MAEVLGVFDAQAFVVLVVAVIGLVPVLLYRKATPTVLVVPYAFLTVAAFATNFENVILPDVLNFTEHLVGNLGAGVGFAVAAYLYRQRSITDESDGSAVGAAGSDTEVG